LIVFQEKLLFITDVKDLINESHFTWNFPPQSHKPMITLKPRAAQIRFSPDKDLMLWDLVARFGDDSW
jgi:hypothetical protein